MSDTLTTTARLLVVREILEDDNGATIRFADDGVTGMIVRDEHYATNLRAARRSHERQHPIGVIFAEGSAVAEIARADNDIPTRIWPDGPDRLSVVFQGHDGVFRVRLDQPAAARIRDLLSNAILQNVRVWFIAQKPELAILDVLVFREATGEKQI